MHFRPTDRGTLVVNSFQHEPVPWYTVAHLQGVLQRETFKRPYLSRQKFRHAVMQLETYKTNQFPDKSGN